MASSSSRDAAVEEGVKMAHRTFQLKGATHNVVHLQEQYLAALLAIAYEAGYEKGLADVKRPSDNA